MFSEERLKAILGTILSVPPETISAESNKDNIQSWDSIRHMNLILALEEEFGVVIPDEEAADLTSYPLIKLVMTELTA
jgi:acyl carrier protein